MGNKWARDSLIETAVAQNPSRRGMRGNDRDAKAGNDEEQLEENGTRR